MYCQKETLHLRIRDWAKEDRPREKLMQKGNKALTDAELLGILIGSGTRKMSAVTLAQLILKHHDNDLDVLAKRSVKELQQFKGIGEAKAIKIVSAMELSRRREGFTSLPKPRFYDSTGIYHFMKPELADKTTEEFWVVLLNRANRLIKKQFISSGGLTSTLADPKVVFKAAVEYGATSMVLLHNHPSGNPDPSKKDIELTKRLIEGGQTLDIDILDHIIIAGNTYFSFVDDKLLFKPTPLAVTQEIA